MIFFPFIPSLLKIHTTQNIGNAEKKKSRFFVFHNLPYTDSGFGIIRKTTTKFYKTLPLAAVQIFCLWGSPT